ncbi:facilitated trehalose transporter Tret1-like [Teleopsis dalmanni]|uniref:facilitated trehalose transporter Tret1-like n=1 Tax=Teleopsis dalmanni TaxID=139649 RepID=UPI0018CE7464|nr:facilitated trehalose transporter Tret1-like [Teleopsis dalmanni]
MSEGKKFPQIIAGLAAAGGAFACGTTLGWSAPVQHAIQDGFYGFKVSNVEYSWVSSLITLGAACACIPIGIVINIIGRKPTMLLLVIPLMVGWCMLLFAKNVAMLSAARFILGFSGGAFCITAPVYTTEIAQNEVRGMLGSFFQLLLVIGVTYTYVVGAFLDVFWMSACCAAIPIIFVVCFICMPESPVYLVMKDKMDAAKNSYKFLRGADYDPTTEINEIRSTQQSKDENSGPIKALCRGVVMKALGMSMALMFFQQLGGINAIVFYSTDMFKNAKTGISAEMTTILIGVLMVVFTFVATLFIDKLGRRLLLMSSGLSMALATFAMGIYFYMYDNDKNSVESIKVLPVIAVLFFIIMFSVGYGPVPWLFMAEVFTPDAKAYAGPISGTSNWLMAFIVTNTFLLVRDAIGTGTTFFLFTLISVIGFIFVLIVIPETKGKSITEITMEIEGKKA